MTHIIPIHPILPIFPITIRGIINAKNYPLCDVRSAIF